MRYPLENLSDKGIEQAILRIRREIDLAEQHRLTADAFLSSLKMTLEQLELELARRKLRRLYEW